MAISPNSQEKEAIEIGRIYGDAETVILEQITRRLERGIDEPGWREEKLAQIQAIRKVLSEEVNTLDQASERQVQALIEKAYENGIQSADADIRTLIRAGLDDSNVRISVDSSSKGVFGAINEQAVEALAKETINTLKQSHFRILRVTEDKYRDIVSQNLSGGLTGAETRRQTTQRMLNEFADRGISNFVDKAGRHWEMQSYAEMATRAALGNAAINGHINRMQQNGMDLVIVSDHPDECEICRPWERRILSVSGESTEYPSVKQARAAGLFHPACGHTLNAYVPGLTKVDTPEADPKGYEVKQQQRYIERQIRRWKRREAVAMDEAERKKTKAKVREWQTKNRKLVEDNNLRRKYERESITRAR